MNTFTTIYFKTKNTFRYLDNQFEDELDLRINVILIFVGLIMSIGFLFDGKITSQGSLFIAIAFVFSGGFMLVVGRYVTSYIIYGISRLLGGTAKILDVRVVVAYAQLPLLLFLPYFLIVRECQVYGVSHSTLAVIAFLLGLVIWLLKLKIFLGGLKYFNRFGNGKTLLNITPIILVGIVVHLLTIQEIILR